MNGYAVLIMSGRHLIYYKRFGPDEVSVAARFFSLLQEGKFGNGVEVIFTNDIEIPDILIAQNTELDLNPLVI